MAININVNVYLHENQDCVSNSEILNFLQQLRTDIMGNFADVLANEGTEATQLGVLATAVQSLLDAYNALVAQLQNAPTQADVDAAIVAQQANIAAVNATLATLPQQVASPAALKKD